MRPDKGKAYKASVIYVYSPLEMRKQVEDFIRFKEGEA